MSWTARSLQNFVDPYAHLEGDVSQWQGVLSKGIGALCDLTKGYFSSRFLIQTF